jgi:hypothetical protein
MNKENLVQADFGPFIEARAVPSNTKAFEISEYEFQFKAKDMILKGSKI